MYRYFFLIALLLVFACDNSKHKNPSGSNNKLGDGILNDTEKELIQTSINEVNKYAINFLANADSLQNFANKINTIKQNKQVKNAWLSQNAFHISFYDGGLYSWALNTKQLLPPFGENIQPQTRAGSKNNQHALIINSSIYDLNNSAFYTVSKKLNTRLSQSGFLTSIKNGQSANISFLQNYLNTYNLVVWLANGFFDENLFWLFTGEEAYFNAINSAYLSQWQNNKISVSYMPITTINSLQLKPYYVVSKNFFEKVKANSVFLFTANQSLANNYSFAKKLVSLGALSTLGFTGNNLYSAGAIKLSCDALIGGGTIQQSLNAVNKKYVSNYAYYPNSSNSLKLVNNTTNCSIAFASPSNNSSYPIPDIILEGRFVNAYATNYGVVSINNEISFPLRIKQNNRKEFLMPILISSGQNKINIDCYGIDENNKSIFASQTIDVVGNFSPMQMQSILTWNSGGNYYGDTSNVYTDIDLHLLNNNCSHDSLFTANDCHYNKKITSWGAKLYEDNTYGFGPEGIYLNNAKAGIYTLYAYAHHCPQSTKAFVSVKTNSQVVNSNALTFTQNNQVYKVATITLPSGEINFYNKPVIVKTLKRVEKK